MRKNKRYGTQTLMQMKMFCECLAISVGISESRNYLRMFRYLFLSQTEAVLIFKFNNKLKIRQNELSNLITIYWE